MECYQFTLDLSGNSAIPSQYKIGLREVCKWISHQAKNQRDIQVTNHYHRGCYNVQTGDKKTAEFLKTFVLEINWNGKTHRVALKPSMPDKPRIWVRFWGTCRGVSWRTRISTGCSRPPVLTSCGRRRSANTSNPTFSTDNDRRYVNVDRATSSASTSG